jgi:hypothetical protein
MFWTLLLAHFVADYPLQPYWMVKAKQNPWVLGLHASIHLATMLLLVGPGRAATWPLLLLVAIVHFLIDAVKNEVTRRKPSWVVIPYLVDQGVHYITLGLAALLMERFVSPVNLLFDRTTLIYLIGFMLATYVWFISERIFSHSNETYRSEVIAQYWPRMVVRALLLGIFLFSTGAFATQAVAAATIILLPYSSGKYAVQALITDFLVALVVMTFIRLIVR